MLTVNNLTGFGSRRRVTSLTFVDSATSTLATATIPAGAQAGDIAVLADYAADATDASPDVVPTGWTGWGALTSFNNGVDFWYGRLSYKILTASDPGDGITGLDGSYGAVKVMFVFRGDVPASTITASTLNIEATGGNPASQSVTATAGTVPLVVIGAAGEFQGNGTFSTANPAFDATVATSNNDLLAGYKIYNSAPADHTIDMNDLGDDNFLASGYLAIS